MRSESLFCCKFLLANQCEVLERLCRVFLRVSCICKNEFYMKKNEKVDYCVRPKDLTKNEFTWHNPSKSVCSYFRSCTTAPPTKDYFIVFLSSQFPSAVEVEREHISPSPHHCLWGLKTYFSCMLTVLTLAVECFQHSYSPCLPLISPTSGTLSFNLGTLRSLQYFPYAFQLEQCQWSSYYMAWYPSPHTPQNNLCWV